MTNVPANVGSATPTDPSGAVRGEGVVYDVRRPGWLPRTNLPIATLSELERPIAHDAQYVAKRVIDRIGALAILIALSPVMLAIVVAIKASSRGPVLFRSTRKGLGGDRFSCLKFRTMYIGADRLQGELEEQNEADGPIFKIAEDPRITPVGSILRRTSLDELPQLFNVLRGQMSLVGPRPLPLRDCALLGEHEQRRHSVLPGMTGLWQIHPTRHQGASIVELDLEYIDRWSLWRDAWILLRTVAVVIAGKAEGRSGRPKDRP